MNDWCKHCSYLSHKTYLMAQHPWVVYRWNSLIIWAVATVNVRVTNTTSHNLHNELVVFWLSEAHILHGPLALAETAA